jgi:hypothetical protein
MCARSKIHAFNFMDPPEWKLTIIKSKFPDLIHFMLPLKTCHFLFSAEFENESQM